jgi:iron(III) transport system ATP-binding protein
MPLIELSGVTKIYQNTKTQAIHNISLGIEKGEILALLGPSGSGKTTLLRLIAGFEQLDKGTIWLKGAEVTRPLVPPEFRGIGMVFQDGGLFPHLTVSQNIAFGLYLYNQSEQEKKVHKMLDLVSLSGFENRYPHQLSGGQQQRVALARALAPNPIVLLLDEPFSGLDPDMRSKMREELHAILDQIGMTALFVTHDHEEAFSMANRVAILNHGCLEQVDTPDVVYHLPATPFVADFVGQADFVLGETQSNGFIQTEIGSFPNTKNDPSGKQVAVMVRPDDLHLIPDPKGSAHILSKQFRGSENLYAIGLPSGQRVHTSEHSLALYPVGTPVRLELAATHTVVFDWDAIKKITP